jgi:hypothetical protein
VTNVGAIRLFLTLLSSSLSLVPLISRLPSTLPLIELVALCPPVMLIGVCGGVVNGKPTGGAELVAVTSGTWPRVGVGLLPCELV